MEDVTRRRLLQSLCSTSVVQCIIGAILLILGLVSRTNHGPYQTGVPPYYVGTFICMTTVTCQSLLGFVIFYKGQNCVNKQDVAKKLGCWMQTYSFFTVISGMGHIVSTLLVGFAGVCTSGYCSYLDNERENRNLAVSMLVFILLALISSAIGLSIVCIYSSGFGFKMLARGQYQVSPLDDRVVTNIEQTPVVEISSSPTPTTANSIHNNHIHHTQPDPRLATPAPDFSSHHVSHYLTQQYRERIRKRKKKKTNKENHSSNRKRNNRQNRSSPYVLPPLSTLSNPSFPQPPSPPRVQRHYSPSPPPAPVSPSSVPHIITTPASPPPWSLTPSPPPPPPSPPMDYLRVVHVIPCGEYTDDDSSLYSCF